MTNFEEYEDDDPNVIGMATNGDGRTVVFISAPGDTLNWQRLVLFPTLDKDRVIVATPYEPLVGIGGANPEQVKDYLNEFLGDALMLAEQHFQSVG